MAQVRHAMDALERIAPKRLAFSFDKVGLQVGNPSAELRRGVVSLDRSLGAVRFAVANDAQMLVSHHPLLFEPIGSVLHSSHVGRTILELAKHDIAFAAAHTNWDSAEGGINDALAGAFGLQDVRSFGSAAAVTRFKLVVFCPVESVEAVIDAAAVAGAGQIGHYSRCAFTHGGTGTFLGDDKSNPTVGQAGQVERVDEVRVEMVVPEERAQAVAHAVRQAHPYEEPAFDFFALVADHEQPAGRTGSLPANMTLKELAQYAELRLGDPCLTWGDPSRSVRRLAVVGGSADMEWRKAREAGADALLTGEVKQHVGLEAAEQGFGVIAAGHYATEQPGCAALRDRLQSELGDVDWLLYTPEAGFSGRPFAQSRSGED